MDWIETLSAVEDLVSDAEINLLWASGSGLGAVLLAVVAIVLIVRLRKPDGLVKLAAETLRDGKDRVTKD